MVTDVLVTAGGMGTRIKELGMEKPMIPVSGVPLVRRVLDALNECDSVGDVVVSVSGNVPLTREYLRREGFRTVETSGIEYVRDLGAGLSALGTDSAMICPADVPLLKPRHVASLLAKYPGSGAQSLSVAVPHELLKSLGGRPSYRFEVDGVDTVLCGLSVVDRRRMVAGEVLTEGYVITWEPELALNVNTPDDLRAAERLLAEGK